MNRSLPRRVASALALIVALLAVLTPKADAQSDTFSESFDVELVSQSSYVRAGEAFTMTLDIRGALPTDQIKIETWGQSREPAQRRELREAVESGDPEESNLVRLGSGPYSAVYGEVLDPTTGDATITIPEGPANNDPGVYPLTVSIQRGSARNRTSTLLTTTLVRLGPITSANEPLDVALVLPVAAELSHHADGTTALPAEDRARLEALTGLVAGSLASVPLTLEPRPETLDAVAEGAVAGGAEDVALLAGIQALAEDRPVLGGTYVPIDDEALRRRDLDFLVGELHAAGERAIIDASLGKPDTTLVRSDPSDTADTLTLRKQFGAGALLVAEDSLEPLNEDRFPVTLLQSFVVEDSTRTPLRAVASDGYLTDLAAQLDDTDRADEQPLLAQRFLADLVAGYYDDPAVTRGAVVVLPDDWDVSSDGIAELLSDLNAIPELDLTTVDSLLDSVSAAAPSGGGRVATPASGPLVRHLRPTDATDLGTYPGREATIDRELRGFESVAGVPSGPQSADLERFRLISADERLDADGRNAYLDAIDARVGTRLLAPDGGPGFVGPGKQRVTMTSRRATIPIQIDNRLGFPADVRIELESEKLDFPTGWLRETTLAPGMNTIEVEVEATTSGDSLLEVTVLAPDAGSGIGVLATGSYTVRSTALSGVGLVISIVALCVLLVWWGRHVLRTRRVRRAGGDAPSRAPVTPAAAVDDDADRADSDAPAGVVPTDDLVPHDVEPTPSLTRTEP